VARNTRFAFKKHTAPSSMTATSSVPVQSLNQEPLGNGKSKVKGGTNFPPILGISSLLESAGLLSTVSYWSTRSLDTLI
jgi:hypothetical protein